MTNVQPEAERRAIKAAERRRALGRLRGLAARLDHQACLIRNGGFNPKAEAEAGRLADDAFAIRWALRRIAPEAEAVEQVFESLHSMGRPPRSSSGGI
jgi:hypothetical protein